MSDEEFSQLQSVLEDYKKRTSAVEQQREQYVESAIESRYESKDYVNHEGYLQLLKTIPQDQIRLLTTRRINGEDCTFVLMEEDYPELVEYYNLETNLANATLDTLRVLLMKEEALRESSGQRLIE